MTGSSTVKVFYIKTGPSSCKKLRIEDDWYVETPTLFDCGADGGAMTEELSKGVSLYTFKPRKIAVQTVNGTPENNYKIRRIRVRTYRDVIRNFDSIVVPDIGKEEVETGK